MIINILKTKEVNTPLYDKMRGVNVLFKEIWNEKSCIRCEYNSTTLFYNKNGQFSTQFPNGEVILVPSKEMQDWSKFAWKKGDVLASIENDFFIIFDHFENDEYTSFYGKYACDADDAEWFETVPYVKTGRFNKVNNDINKSYLLDIEEHWKGKLNLKTLDIEQPKQEFKEGDIVSVIDVYGNTSICIVKNIDGNKLEYYASNYHIEDWLNIEGKVVSLATDSEKQQLYDALAKEGKTWDEEKKMLIDLPKKGEFKPMDWCLMRNENSLWHLCQFSFKNILFDAIGGNVYDECIPYNDSTKHLLGTTDEWKEGENG